MKAAIYIRKSREEKDKPSHRLQVQREQLPAHAEAQGWQIEIYDDGHASAAQGKTESLKERGRLEADIRAGKINIILTIELSRLSRDDSLQDYVAWLDLCSKHNVKLATMSRILDPGQHSDWMLLLMEGGFSSVEMRVLKGRMKQGYDQALRAGKFLGGQPPPPYRYDHEQGRPVIDPEQLPRMKELWQLAETTSARQVAELLKMPEIAVRRAISDARLEFYQAKRLDPETLEEIVCDWEPCMSTEQALRIRAGRRTRKNGTTRASFSSLFSGLGLLYCGYCGKTAKTWHNSRIRKDGTRNDYYGCQSSSSKNKCERARLVAQETLNEKVLTNLFNTIGRLAEIQKFWLCQNSDNPQDQLNDLDKKVRSEQAKKQRLVEAVSEGIFDLVDAKSKMAEINERIEQAQKEKNNIMKSLTAAPDWESLMLTKEEFEMLDAAHQREFLKLALERITLYAGHAVITYPFPRSQSGDKTAQINLPHKA